MRIVGIKDKIDAKLKILPTIPPKADYASHKAQTIMDKHRCLASVLNNILKTNNKTA